ncbi:GNAT family N-acetyltransferase [Cupriavidus respiraculi]|uniref:GNAT family N-acetyltransferase n=1 Tax=Cupriavidus respiraculi TaxID=195930 RepID=UPI001C978E2A|nr:GNAT family N-acetyltransferase [Cupriavidus respiraculi]MBY4947284.1 GNAT family N-acetyltransferase [Cupriavidus respiraculi]
MSAPTLTSSRLILRPWRESDLPAFASMNADSRVMRFFPATLSRQDSDALAARIRARMQAHPFGFWAVEIPGVADFAGFVGLSIPAFEAHFTPCMEIGWRLAAPFWGCGYATEAATAALDHAFHTLNVPEVVAFTATSNLPSRAVMERLGMLHDADEDFDHPAVPEGHALRRHVLYRMRKQGWPPR